MPRLSRLAVFLIGAALGLAIWTLPPLLFGKGEPWAGQGPGYALALLVTGLLLGFVGPGQLVVAVAGVLGGQLLVLLARFAADPATSELWLVGVVLLVGYTVAATGLGAVLGNALRRRLGPIPRGEDRRSS
jgi:hypothetical protein